MLRASLERQIQCVRREIGFREKVYPRWVQLHKMSAEKASDERLAMESVLDTLLALHGEREAAKAFGVQNSAAAATTACSDG